MHEVPAPVAYYAYCHCSCGGRWVISARSDLVSVASLPQQMASGSMAVQARFSSIDRCELRQGILLYQVYVG